MRRRVLTALLLAAGALGGPASGVALAHGETSPLFRTVVDGISPSVPGLGAQTDTNQPDYIAFRNLTRTEVTVLGDVGEPFLRIGPDGAFANVNSVTWRASGNPDGLVVQAPAADLRRTTAPRWIRLSTHPLWGWFDRRLEPPAAPVPQQVAQGRRPFRMVGWSLPLRYGLRTLQLQGHVEFRPPVGGIMTTLRSPPRPGPGVLVGVLAGDAPGLFVQNTGPQTVTVLGSDGRPFARIGPDGVEVNLRSPTYWAQPPGEGPAPAPAGAGPLWWRASSAPEYGWVDPRLAYGHIEPSDDIERQDHRVILRRWSVPVQSASGRWQVSGSTDWVPLEQPGDSTSAGAGATGRLLWWAASCAAAAALAALGALGLRRRAERLPTVEGGRVA